MSDFGLIMPINPDNPERFEKKGELFVPKSQSPYGNLVLGGGYFQTPPVMPNYTFTWTGLFGGTPTPKAPKPETVEPRIDPFVGWKTLSIHVTKNGKLRLLGAGNIKYEIDATAECNRGGGHDVPDWECSCGFYALSERPTTAECGWFMARVELFGTVIEGEHGWRASRQRVLSMETFRECQAQKNYNECGRKADGFQVSRGGKVYPVCAKHAPLGSSSLADVTAALGTQVSWLAR